MNRYRRDNRELWDAWTAVHARSRFYDLDGFRAGKSSLREIELEAIGDVQGKSLLHLQCHFGLDTLSWARLGARATGVDLSPKSIELARSLAGELRIPARFVCSDLYDLPDVLDGTFDVVFTSYGVLYWLADLPRWAEIVARYLAPGGRFQIVEFHPLLEMLAANGRTLEGSYFRGERPISEEASGTYAEPEAPVRGRAHGWPYPLGEVVEALITAGLRIDFLREFDYSPYDCFPFTTRAAPGRYVVDGFAGKVPLVFSLGASRERGARRPEGA